MALLFSSCNINYNGLETVLPQGAVVKKEIVLDADFTKIKASNSVNVIVSQNNTCSATIEAHENLQKHILVEVKDQTLIIKKDKNFGPNSIANVYVSLPNLEAVKATSASNVKSNTLLKSNDLTITASSAATIELETVTKNLEIKASSASEVFLTGKTIELTMKSSSAAEVETEKLVSKNANVAVSSGATAKITALNNVSATASSGAQILYNANTEQILSKTSSGGSIKAY